MSSTAPKEQRRSGAFYTPTSLAFPIVETTLRPLFEAMGPTPSSAQVLGLRICDPAVGSGVFLLGALRLIGARLAEAWAREGKPDAEASALAVVSETCLYGVDKNPLAIRLATLALQMATLRRDRELTFHKHALRCGDALVGIDDKRTLEWLAEGFTEKAARRRVGGR